jgi:Carboxypeptidase regulatory-like domain
MTRAPLRQLLSFLILITAGLVSKAQVNTAYLSGLVTDPTGAVLPHVNVSVTNKATGYGRTVSTDGAGLYSFQDLPIGQYSVSVNDPGFNTINETVTLTVGQRAREDFHLQVGSA